MCTGIEIISNQGNPFWGRTQDFEQHFEYAGIKIPVGTHIDSTYTPFITRCAVMGIVWAENVHENPVVLDGINEHGICGGSFYFDHFYRYASKETVDRSGKVALRGEELVTWILTHYRSLDEIRKNLNRDIGIVDEPGPMMGMSVPQHGVFQDRTGRCIVVEPSVENGFRIFDNPVGIFTNAPGFDWQLANLKTHLERSTQRSYTYRPGEPIDLIKPDEHCSGLVGIPSDYKPESRFLRASYVKLLSTPVNDDDAVNEIFQLLNTVTNPKGALRIASKGKTIIPWTQYTSAYDIRSRTLYAHTYDNHDVYEMNFGDASEWGRTRYFDFIRPRAYKSFVEER
jgi:choloylglycine hydrolase